jgi:hypothetical protein
MEAFHNDRAVKAKYLKRVRAHAKADRLIQGMGWENGRGCAIGCTLENYDHSRYPIELGVPLELARLEDCIFERLPKADAMKWPAAFLSAIPVGADLSMVWPRFALWMLRGLPELTRPDVKAAVDGVVTLYEQWVDLGVKPAAEKWRKARSAAADAAAYAAYAAYADAAAAAYAAAYAAYAAYAAAYAAGRLARRKFLQSASKELLRLLKTAQPTGETKP